MVFASFYPLVTVFKLELAKLTQIQTNLHLRLLRSVRSHPTRLFRNFNCNDMAHVNMVVKIADVSPYGVGLKFVLVQRDCRSLCLGSH